MPRFDAAYVPATAMSIFAHPDDAEFGVAGTLATWARAGCRVTMVLCTSGNAGTQDTAYTPAALAELRETEQLEAARILGVEDVVFLRRDDCRLQPDLELRRALVRAIRQHKPEVVLCNDPTGWFLGEGYINHPDHRAAATAALEATFPCAEMPLLWPEEGPAHKVGAAYIAWGEGRNVWIDVSDAMEAKVAALRAHASQMGDWDPTELLRSWARSDAKEGRRRRKAARAREKAGRGRDDGEPRVSAAKGKYTESYRVMILDREAMPPES